MDSKNDRFRQINFTVQVSSLCNNPDWITLLSINSGQILSL